MYKKGFTLLELLVVIAIIGGLSALILPNFMAARERARDSQRKSDLKQIQKALELYLLDQITPAYPAALPSPGGCWNSASSYAPGTACPATTPIYTNKFPFDPKGTTPTPYFYSRTSTIDYTLCACLENTADTDGIVCTSCTGFSCGTSKCYIVNQP